MDVISNDSSKFKEIGSVNVCNNTNKIEAWIQWRFLSVSKSNQISKDVFNIISILLLVRHNKNWPNGSLKYVKVFQIYFPPMVFLASLNFLTLLEICSKNKLLMSLDIVSLYKNVSLE